jgi:hypothetical protein
MREALQRAGGVVVETIEDARTVLDRVSFPAAASSSAPRRTRGWRADTAPPELTPARARGIG